MSLAQFSQQTPIISLHNINSLNFIMGNGCVPCEGRTGFINKIDTNFSLRRLTVGDSYVILRPHFKEQLKFRVYCTTKFISKKHIPNFRLPTSTITVTQYLSAVPPEEFKSLDFLLTYGCKLQQQILIYTLPLPDCSVSPMSARISDRASS
jgi:hypothetical protein